MKSYHFEKFRNFFIVTLGEVTILILGVIVTLKKKFIFMTQTLTVLIVEFIDLIPVKAIPSFKIILMLHPYLNKQDKG